MGMRNFVMLTPASREVNMKKHTFPVILCTLTFCVSHLWGVQYEIANLGGDSTWALDINDSGQVTGDTFYNNKSYPFIWDKVNGLQRLPSLGGSYSEGTAINNNGSVVGWSGSVGNAQEHAFVWDGNNGITDIGTLGDVSSQAIDINDSGVVVGYTRWWSGTPTAFIYDEVSGMRRLSEIVPEDSEWTHFGRVYDIDNSGRIVGEGEIGEERYSFLLDADSGLINLTELLGSERTVTGLNDSGQFIGSLAVQFTDGRAFFWDGTNDPVDLGVLEGRESSHAYDMNESGQIVGDSHSYNIRTHPVLWEDGELFDLNDLILPDSGWELSRAFGINNSGEIVGIGDYEGSLAAYILTPIPEPGTVLLLAVGGGFVLRRKKQK